MEMLLEEWWITLPVGSIVVIMSFFWVKDRLDEKRKVKKFREFLKKPVVPEDS